MTHEEAKSVNVGDWVESPRSNGYRLCVVTAISRGKGDVFFTVRPLVKNRRGELLPATSHHRAHVRSGTGGRYWSNESTETANVFADWLEEQGQDEAAGMLRSKFPIAKAGLTEWRGQ